MDIKNQNKRRLSERSHLTIEFPQSDNRVVRTFIPFLENPTVSEKGKANLNSYDLVGRAGQLFSYGGAESRKLSVTFQITLLHVMEEEKDLDEMFRSQFKLFFSESGQAIEAFKLGSITHPITPNPRGERFPGHPENGGTADPGSEHAGGVAQADVAPGKERNHAKIHRDYYTELLKSMAGFDPPEEVARIQYSGMTTRAAFPDTPSPKAAKRPQANTDSLDSTINLVYFWVNLIRASVLNNSRSTTLGPPIVRLTHGGMYNNVPCLLQDYSINILDEAGFDVQTMTPKRLEISLNLIESRTGNFGKFQAGQIDFGDNLTGWESVIETNNIDPYNGLIGAGA